MKEPQDYAWIWTNPEAAENYLRTVETSKQFIEIAEKTISCLTEENISPEIIEQILKKIHRLKPESLYLTIRRSYLEKRKKMLDKAFEFTPENIEKLKRVNQILTENSQKVLTQAKKIYEQLQTQPDDFTQDYEIEGTVRVSYNGDQSLIDFDPEKDEIYGESEHPHIAEIIDDAMFKSYPQNLYGCHFNEKAKPDENNEKDIFWEYGINNIPPIAGVRFCMAFHNLADHTLYALQDIVRLNYFWNSLSLSSNQRIVLASISSETVL